MSNELKDQLRKMGLRVRPRTPAGSQQHKAGKIAFDVRGNAVYEWENESLAADGDAGDRLRRRALAHPGLSLVDEEPPNNGPIQKNPKGLRVGYNPYESGMLVKKEWKKKKDLRELSKWVELRRRVQNEPED